MYRSKIPSYDFLGLEIDIGFRLASLTHPGRVIVSIDTADLISASRLISIPVRLHHVGWVQLKGVLSGVPYPVIFSDSMAEDARPKKRNSFEGYSDPRLNCYLSGEAIKSPKEISDLNDSHIKDCKGQRIKMYIEANKMPNAHRERWGRANDRD